MSSGRYLNQRAVGQASRSAVRSSGAVQAKKSSDGGVSMRQKRLSISQSLQSRPSQKQALREQGSSAQIAPALAANAKALQRGMTRNSISMHLHSRPNMAEVLSSGVMKQSNVAPSLRRASLALSNKMKKDSVSQHLESRPDLQTLKDWNILETTEVAPAIQATQRKLKSNLARSNLYHALGARKSINELYDAGIYQPVDEPESSSSESEDSEEEQYYREAREQVATVDTQQQQQEGPSEGERFQYTVLLLRYVVVLHNAGDITQEEKGQLKDKIVAQDTTILAIAECFVYDSSFEDFRTSLHALVR